MHVLVSILIIIALVFGVMFFLPDACAKDNTGNGGGTGKTKKEIIDMTDPVARQAEMMNNLSLFGIE